MIENPLVSIIIPVYNVAPYLEEALDSVVNQTYTNLEIIIIDDGSTDDSYKKCEKYAAKDTRIRLIHQENKGLSTARNVGLNVMKGDIVAFLDPDDIMHRSLIEIMLSYLIKEPEIDMAVCRYSICDDMSSIAYKKDYIYPSIFAGIYDCREILQAIVEEKCNNNVWNKLYRRELWSYIRFPDGHVYEDTDTVYKVINLCKKISVVDQILYYHRRRNDSISNTFSQMVIQDRILAWSHFDGFIHENIPNIFSEEQLNNLLKTQIHILIYYFANMGNSEGEKLFCRDLQKEIHKMEKEINEKELRLRISCWMINNYPSAFKILYTIFNFLHVGVRPCAQPRVLRIVGRKRPPDKP